MSQISLVHHFLSSLAVMWAFRASVCLVTTTNTPFTILGMMVAERRDELGEEKNHEIKNVHLHINMNLIFKYNLKINCKVSRLTKFDFSYLLDVAIQSD